MMHEGTYPTDYNVSSPSFRGELVIDTEWFSLSKAGCRFQNFFWGATKLRREGFIIVWQV